MTWYMEHPLTSTMLNFMYFDGYIGMTSQGVALFFNIQRIQRTYNSCKNIYLFDKVSERGREKENLSFVGLLSNASNCQGWVRPKPGDVNCLWVYHLGGRAQALVASCTAFPNALALEQDLKRNSQYWNWHKYRLYMLQHNTRSYDNFWCFEWSNCGDWSHWSFAVYYFCYLIFN